MKEKLKFIYVAIISGLLCSVVSVYATITYTAAQITYGNTTVGSALDSLYTSANETIENKDAQITNLTNQLNKFNTFMVRLRGVSNATQQLIVNSSDISLVKNYKYFTFTLSPDENTSSCYIRAYSRVKAGFDDLIPNTRYEILSNTDNKTYSGIYLYVSSNSNELAYCDGNIVFSN